MASAAQQEQYIVNASTDCTEISEDFCLRLNMNSGGYKDGDLLAYLLNWYPLSKNAKDIVLAKKFGAFPPDLMLKVVNDVKGIKILYSGMMPVRIDPDHRALIVKYIERKCKGLLARVSIPCSVRAIGAITPSLIEQLNRYEVKIGGRLVGQGELLQSASMAASRACPKGPSTSFSRARLAAAPSSITIFAIANPGHNFIQVLYDHEGKAMQIYQPHLYNIIRWVETRKVNIAGASSSTRSHS